MKTLSLKIELLNDVVLSENHATQGGHSSLDYIPGSALLGIAARSYDELNPEHMANLFHNGMVRFEDGHPGIGGGATYKTPLTLFKPKSIAGAHGFHHFDLEKRNNQTNQSKQDPSGYVFKEKRTYPKKGFQLRTAIEGGVAKDGSLYGYESLLAGQVYYAAISSTNEALLNDAAARIEGIQRIGRSKTAEYGLVNISVMETATLHETNHLAGELFVYLASDLVLFNEFGHPKTTPDTAIDLGLPEGSTVNWEKSVVRTRSFIPYNGKRRSFGAEVYCIQKGSVFCTHLPTSFTSRSHCLHAGHFQSEGKGRLLLVQEGSDLYQTIFETTHQVVECEKVFLTGPASPYLSEANAALVRFGGKQRSNIRNLKEMEDLSEKIRLPDRASYSKSQWRDIFNSIKRSQKTDATGLFDELTSISSTKTIAGFANENSHLKEFMMNNFPLAKEALLRSLKMKASGFDAKK